MNKWKGLSPQARARLAERLREKNRADEEARKQQARRARRQPLGRQGFHRIELNPDGQTYRCLTCLLTSKTPRR